MIGDKIESKDLDLFGDRLEVLSDGKIWITGFVSFQYGELSEQCKPHLAVIKRLKATGLWERVGKGLAKGSPTLQEKEKDKEKELDMDMDEYKKMYSGSIQSNSTNLSNNPPTLEDCVKASAQAGLRQSEIEKCFHYYNARGWKTAKGVPLVNLSSVMASWKSNEKGEKENETPKWKKLEILKEHVSKFTAQNPHPDRWTQEQRDALKKNREEIKKLEMEMVK